MTEDGFERVAAYAASRWREVARAAEDLADHYRASAGIGMPPTNRLNVAVMEAKDATERVEDAAEELRRQHAKR